MDRRSFLTGIAGILASGVAPAVLPSGVIMPIKKLAILDLPYPIIRWVYNYDMDRIRKLNPNDLVPLWERELGNAMGNPPFDSLSGRYIDVLDASQLKGSLGNASPLAQDVFRARLLRQRRSPG